MNNKKRLIVLFSILFLVAGVFFSCGNNEEQAQNAPQNTNEGMAQREETQPDVTAKAPLPEQNQQDLAQQNGTDSGTPQSATPQSGSEMSQSGQGTQGGQEMAQSGQQPGQMQASQDWIGQEVNSRDGQMLGTVSELYSSTEGGENYVIVKSEDDRLHPVPVNLLNKNSQGQGLVASIDQSTFQQAPSISQAEQQRLSESEFEQEVRGYYQQAGSTGGTPSQNQGQKSQSQ